MKTISYHTMEKESWGKGPWINEPDKKQWQDKVTGYACLIQRSDVTGSLCGYVGVPLTNKMFGKHYDKPDVSVHGGLTFAGLCHEGKDQSHGICHVSDDGKPVYWFGFDCAHYMDKSPKMEATMREFGGYVGTHHAQDVYRDVKYVTNQVESLAARLYQYEEKGILRRIKGTLAFPVVWVKDTRTFRRLTMKLTMRKLRRFTKEMKKADKKCDVCGKKASEVRELNKKLRKKDLEKLCDGCHSLTDNWVAHYQKLVWKRVQRKLAQVRELIKNNS